MKTGTTYFTILIATIATITIGFLLPVPAIKSFTLTTSVVLKPQTLAQSLYHEAVIQSPAFTLQLSALVISV